MFVAGCGGSDAADDGNADEQSAEADANGEEEPAEDDSAAEEEPAEDDSAAEEPVEDGADESAEDEGAEDEGGSDPAASGVVAPAEDFDPCTVVDVAAVSDSVGFDVEDGSSDELMGGLNCTFVSAGNADSVLIQWIPIEADLDQMVESVESTYDNMSELEQLDVPGASEARGFTAEVMSQQAAAVFAAVDGGMFQVMVISEDGTIDAARALTELTLSKV